MRNWIDTASRLSSAQRVVADFESHPDVTLDMEACGDDEIFISWMENGGERGLGMQALTQLCRLADANHVKLSLRVAGGDTEDEEYDEEEDDSAFLVAYYERLGFRVDKFVPGPFDGFYMSREPAPSA